MGAQLASHVSARVRWEGGVSCDGSYWAHVVEEAPVMIHPRVRRVIRIIGVIDGGGNESADQMTGVIAVGEVYMPGWTMRCGVVYRVCQ